MFCVNCKAQLPDNCKICPICGQPVLQAGSSGLEPKKPKESIYIAWIVLSTFVMFAVIFFAVRAHSTKEENATVNEAYDNTAAKDEDAGMNPATGADVDDNEDTGNESGSPQETPAPETTKEELLRREIDKMNRTTGEEQMIDVYEMKRAPGKKDSSFVWKDTVWGTMEGDLKHEDYCSKNRCTLVKKELINKQTGNIMDYYIYINPKTEVANKIVSIEYLEDGVEVTEYYYNNKKKVNLVNRYQTDAYVLADAAADREGQSFLFNKDCLVTWRKTNQDGTRNFCIGKKEKERLKEQWGSDTLFLYNKLRPNQKKRYKKLEKRMLNAAYNTYETVMNAEGIFIIRGTVYDKNMSPLSGAAVELYDESFENKLFETSVKEDGSYRITVPSEENEYNIRVKKDGYGDCDIYHMKINNDLAGLCQEDLTLFEEGLEDQKVSITFENVPQDEDSTEEAERLSNATVNVRRGVNNRADTEIVAIGVTDDKGGIQLVLQPGVYTMEVIADGYETMYYTISINPLTDTRYEFYVDSQDQSGSLVH